MAYGIYADTISSLDSLERSIKGFRESGDNRGLAGSLSSYVAYSCPSLQETTLAEPGVKKLCEDRSEEAIKLTERIGWQAGRAYALFAGGSAWAGFGNLGKGLHLAGELLRVATEIEHQQWIIAANYTLSQIYIYMLACDKAIEHARLALEQSQALGSDWWADHSATNLGTAYLMKGDLTSAERALRLALPEGGTWSRTRFTTGEHSWPGASWPWHAVRHKRLCELQTG